MALQHNTRARMPPNADPEKTKKNVNYGGDMLDCLARYEDIMPEKIRANAVVAVELVMTASPDFNGDWGGYLSACNKWALETFGIDPSKKNILPAIHYAHHYDESTPHTHMLIVPLKDGRLNARHYIGGSRDRMAELQNDFYEKVGQQFELERGQSRAETRARHTPHTLAMAAAELEEKEKKIQDILKVPTAEALQAVSVFRELKTKTPDDFRNLANKIQEKKCDTWGEYRDKMQKELELKEKHQEKKQEIRRGRSR